MLLGEVLTALGTGVRNSSSREFVLFLPLYYILRVSFDHFCPRRECSGVRDTCTMHLCDVFCIFASCWRSDPLCIIKIFRNVSSKHGSLLVHHLYEHWIAPGKPSACHRVFQDRLTKQQKLPSRACTWRNYWIQERISGSSISIQTTYHIAIQPG